MVTTLKFFDTIDVPKIQKSEAYKMTNINFAQSYSNFAQFSKMKKLFLNTRNEIL